MAPGEMLNEGIITEVPSPQLNSHSLFSTVKDHSSAVSGQISFRLRCGDVSKTTH